ncbi:hypothetical protein WME94_54725 [Sorangium sp. So ce429]
MAKQEQLPMFGVDGKPAKRRKKRNGSRPRTIVVEAESSQELPTLEPLRLPPGPPGPPRLPTGMHGADGGGLILVGRRPLGRPRAPQRTSATRNEETAATPRKRGRVMQKAKRRGAVEQAPREQESEERTTPKARKSRTKATRTAAKRTPKPGRGRSAARKAPATTKRGRRGAGTRGLTYICRPSSAETALSKQMRDLSRLLRTTARPGRAKSKPRATARRTR